jgi:hypothetical protein
LIKLKYWADRLALATAGFGVERAIEFSKNGGNGRVAVPVRTPDLSRFHG